jgi:hypothetical protein
MDQVNNRWKNPGDLTNYPKLQWGQPAIEFADRAYTSRSAFALQSISLGYTLPRTLLS